jgi:hypothetical protein
MKRKKNSKAQELPVGTVYGIESPDFLSTGKKMTAGDLIRELQAFPSNAVVLMSEDEEGNYFKLGSNLNGGKFGVHEEHVTGSTHLIDGDPDQLNDYRYSRTGLNAGDPYVLIWPLG